MLRYTVRERAANGRMFPIIGVTKFADAGHAVALAARLVDEGACDCTDVIVSGRSDFVDRVALFRSDSALVSSEASAA